MHCVFVLLAFCLHFAKIQTANITKQYKEMGKTSEKNQLLTMREFLADRKQITTLAERSGVSVRTVYDTFTQASPDLLKGKQLVVFRKAIELINEIKSLPDLAMKAINN